MSLGQVIAASSDVIVNTVYAAGPNDESLSDYDRSCGFATSRAAMGQRRAEDLAACDVLGALVRHGPFFDQQYGRTNDPDLLRAFLLATMGPEHLTFVPLGIGHPDHREIARLCREVLPIEDTIRCLIAYEELPYRVQHPEEVPDAFELWRADGFTIGELPMPLESGPRWVKRMALDRYVSQWPDGPEEPMFYCPERAFQMVR